MEKAVSEKREAFAAAHKSDEDRQAYISTSRRALSVIAKAKAEAWQTTCFSLKSVYSLLRSDAGSSSFSPNFPNRSAFDYMRSHFSVPLPKALRGRARGYLPELHRARALRGLSLPSAPLSPPRNLLRLPQTFLFFCHGRRQSFLSHAKAPSSLWHGFSSSHFQSFLVFAFLSFHLEDIFYYFHQQDRRVYRLSCFLPASSLTSCVSKLFERIVLSFLRPLTRLCFLLLLLGKLSVLVLPHLFGACLPSPWSSHFSHHAPAMIPLSLAKVMLSLTSTLSHLTIWSFGQTALFLFLLAKGQLLTLWH